MILTMLQPVFQMSRKGVTFTLLYFFSVSHEACDCSRFGNNCDPVSGRCICPPNTIGEMCDKCAPNHWGHDIVRGCKVSGSLFSLCVSPLSRWVNTVVCSWDTVLGLYIIVCLCIASSGVSQTVV